jgi:hypothetical protein
MRKRLIGIAVISIISLCISSSAMAEMPSKKNCNVYKGSMVYKKVKHGSTYTFSDGNTEQCDNGEWVLVKQSSSKKKSSSKQSKTIVRQWCETRANGLSSSWWGQSYSWTIWNEWSDGSRTIAKLGSGYEKDLPGGC